MRGQPERRDRPSIKIHVHRAVSDGALEDLLLGIEEEGVPADVVREDERNPLELAHRAANASQLGLGVGIALDYAVVTLDKLPKERPYLATHWSLDPQQDRRCGSNAARIVKRIPLRHEVERSH